MAKPVVNRLGRERRNPQAFDGLRRLRGFVDVAKDQLAFASGIGGADDAADLGAGENAADGLELVLGAFIDDERPLARQNGQVFAAPLPPVGVNLVRLREGNQVADRPGNDIAPTVLIAVSAPTGA